MDLDHSSLEAFALRLERHMERECEAVRREVGTSIDALTDRMDRQNGRVSKLEDKHTNIEVSVKQLENLDLWTLIPTKIKIILGFGALAFLGDFTSHVPFETIWKFVEALV